MISMLKCAWRPNFIFFEIFLLFFKICTKSLFLDRPKTMILYLSKKNSKQFPKNTKFDLHAHFDMKIMLSGSDRLFGLTKRR